jgi:hypothetical protein
MHPFKTALPEISVNQFSAGARNQGPTLAGAEQNIQKSIRFAINALIFSGSRG